MNCPNMYIHLLILLLAGASGSDYYELLGIARSATTQEIRKSFKKLALQLHPDKNPDDENAHMKFAKITRAYEVLKDATKRKHYDIHGDTDGSTAKTKYESYHYYEHQFGLYDDDPHVITLSGLHDFESSVENSETFGQWFVIFYTPYCDSCHHAAPAWSKLASEISGAVSFAALNCEDDWQICRHKVNIRAFPTYVLYPSGATLVGSKNKEELKNFLLERLNTDMVQVETRDFWDDVKNENNRWLLILQRENYVKNNYKILSAMMRGLIGVALIHCSHMPCAEFQLDGQSDYVYFEKEHDLWNTKNIEKEEPSEILNQILSFLPTITKLDPNSFEEYMRELEKGLDVPLLVYFHLGPPSKLDLEVKKLTALLPGFKIGSIHCGRYVDLCSSLSISRYPLFGIFKTGGGREFYHGSHIVQWVASFALESSEAVNFCDCGPNELERALKEGPTLVDFYAPWCPPCVKLLPELRKASLNFGPSVVKFASVDCTVHSDLCRRHSVTSYPTSLLFNVTGKPLKMESRTANSIKEFLDDAISPKVIQLNEQSFFETVGKKKLNELWLVDFYMPWCGPCQQMEPHYRKLAKMMSDYSNVKIAKVNCEEEYYLCQEQGVRSYPHIRLYPMESEGMSTIMIHSGNRDAQSLRRWLFSFLPSSVEELDPERFEAALRSEEPWLVDFFAPWCGHCITFEPDFALVSRKLDTKVKTGKLDCERFHALCARIGIRSYPTLKFFQSNFDKNGLTIQSQNPSTIIETVEMYLESNSIHDEL